MTVADNYDIEKQETNGTTKIFSFNFYTASKDFVKVILEVDGEQSVVPTTDYTIKLNTVGGTVTFTRAPASGGYIIITRETPREQETSFATSSGFPAKTVEGRFDKLTAMIQEMQDTDNRTPSFPVGTDLNVTLPLPEAGKALVWNDTEDNLENSETTFDEIVSDAISAKNDAVSAKEGAETAQGLAEQARDDAQAAQGYAEAAKTAAEYAQSQAENAVNGFDDHVESVKLEINEFVGVAEGYAIAAGHSADDARDYKDAAAGSASDASGYKTDAQTAAGNASTYADNASKWAEGTDEEVQALGGTHSAKEWTNINASSLSAYTKTADLAAVALSNDYDDLSNKPTIGNATLTIEKNGSEAGTFKANATTDKTINITVPTQASDVGALPSSTKYGASLSLSINSSTYVVTAQLKDQDGGNLGSAQTIDLPLESVVVSGSYDDETKKIILTLQSGSTIEFSVADLVAGLQNEITADNPLDADLVDDSTSTNKFVTASDKTTWNGKQDALGYTAENAANKVTSLSNASTDTQYPSAKCVYDELGNKVSDVTVDSTSIVTNGVAAIPNASGSNYGVTKLSNSLTSTSNTSALTPNAINTFAREIVTGTSIFDKTLTYAVGDKVRYGTGYYECITAITTPHAWNASEWQQITIQEQLDEKVSLPDTVAITSGTSFECADNTIYDGGSSAIANVTCTLPATIPPDYSVQINFTSGTTATTFTYDNSIKWVEGCDDTQAVGGVNKFVPVASKRYTVVFISNGVEVIANAKGV